MRVFTPDKMEHCSIVPEQFCVTTVVVDKKDIAAIKALISEHLRNWTSFECMNATCVHIRSISPVN